MAADGVQTESATQEVQPVGMGRKKKIALTIGSAVAVGLACVSIATARQGWVYWRLELVAIDLAAALVGSLLANLVKGTEERGAAWAASLVQGEGGLYHLLSVLPGVAVRAAIMTACLAACNATVVMTEVFRETVVLPPLAVLIRFLADIPQAFVICLVVRLLVDRSVKDC